MPRFFFHLCDGGDVLLDEQGSGMDPAQVPAQALRTARDMIAHDARDGRINLGYALKVRDEAGETVHTLYFHEAVELVGAAAGGGEAGT